MGKPRTHRKGSMRWPVSSVFCHSGVGHRRAGRLLNPASLPTARDVFLLKNQPRYRNLGLEVYVTFFEIYNGKVAGREPFVYAVGAPEVSETLRLARNCRSQTTCGLSSLWATSPKRVGAFIQWWDGTHAQQAWQEYASGPPLRWEVCLCVPCPPSTHLPHNSLLPHSHTRVLSIDVYVSFYLYTFAESSSPSGV